MVFFQKYFFEREVFFQEWFSFHSFLCFFSMCFFLKDFLKEKRGSVFFFQRGLVCFSSKGVLFFFFFEIKLLRKKTKLS